jgi:hypothetical protein
VLELVGVCRSSENGDESVGIKLDDHILDVGIISKCVAVLFPKARTSSVPGNNIYDTSHTGTWPDTTILKFRIFRNTFISVRAGTYSV